MAECISTKTCGCGKCECNLVRSHETEREIICVHDFLYGLDKVHSSVRSQICAQIPLPYLDTVYQTIVQNETVQLNSKHETLTVLTFAAQASTDYNRPSTTPQQNDNRSRYLNPDANVTCTSCGRIGHRATHFFCVIGFPEWWGKRPRARNNQQRGQSNTQSSGQNSTARANSS